MTAMFRRLPVAGRLAAIVAVALIGLGVSVAQLLTTMSNTLFSAREQQVRSVVESAHAMISGYQQKAAKGTRHVSNNVIEVRSAAVETGQSAESVLVQAEGLTSGAHSLEQAVERFLEGIKAA